MRSARSKGVKDKAYLAFLHQFPCIVCTQEGRQQGSPTDAAHVGDRGKSQKCDDSEALPLCGVEHHQYGRASHHKRGRHFWDDHGLDREQLIAHYNQLFHEQRDAKRDPREQDIFCRGVSMQQIVSIGNPMCLFCWDSRSSNMQGGEVIGVPKAKFKAWLKSATVVSKFGAKQ